MIPARLKTAATLAIILLVFGFAGVVHAEESAPELYDLETRLEVRNVGDKASKYVRVRLPLLSTDGSHGEVIEESYNLEPEEIREEDGVRIGVFYIRNLAPGASFTLKVRYTVDRSVREAVDEEWVNLEQPKVAADAPEIIRTANSVTDGLQDREEKVAALLDFTHNHITYDRESPHRNTGALSALNNRAGVCEDYATLFVSLARAAGIESRTVYGYYYSDSRAIWERHAWAQYRDSDGEWTSADPTFSTRTDVDSEGLYIAQWYNDRSVKMGFVGGKIGAEMNTTVAAAR
ncbi:MAG: transglutaminase-like domain-containing protein [Clostridia bacterium]